MSTQIAAKMIKQGNERRSRKHAQVRMEKTTAPMMARDIAMAEPISAKTNISEQGPAVTDYVPTRIDSTALGN